MLRKSTALILSVFLLVAFSLPFVIITAAEESQGESEVVISEVSEDVSSEPVDEPSTVTTDPLPLESSDVPSEPVDEPSTVVTDPIPPESSDVSDVSDDVSEPVVTEPVVTEPVVTEPVENSEPADIYEPDPNSGLSDPATGFETETVDEKDKPKYKPTYGKTECSIMEDGRVALNFAVDGALLKKFKLKIEDFDSLGRVIVSKETFEVLTNKFVENRTGALTGALISSPFDDPTVEMIKQSKSSESAFSDSTAEKAKVLNFGFALDFKETDAKDLSSTPITELGDEGKGMQFEVQIPIPKDMKKCKSFGVAAAGKNELSEMKQPRVENGVISFIAQVDQYYVLVGFMDGKPMPGVEEGMSPILKMAFIGFGLGALFLGGCGFLTYFWFIRKKRPKKVKMNYDDPEDDADEDDTSEMYDEEESEELYDEEDADELDEEMPFYRKKTEEKTEEEQIIEILREIKPDEDVFGLYSHPKDD